MLHETLNWGRQPLTSPIIHRALSKTANQIALAAAMMGGGYTLSWAQKSELSLLPPPLYIWYKLFGTAKILYRACKLKPYKKKTACSVPNVMNHVILGLSNWCACHYRCGGHHFSGPTEKEEPMNWLANISIVKQSIDEFNWYERVPPPDCYQQKTISKEPRGGPSLGSFWIAEGSSPAEVHMSQ